MAFKDNWRPRIDNVDDADVSAVNEIAEAVIENEKDIQDTYRKKEANQIFSNALKGSATGSAVRMDDVSPITHDMAVKVSGADDVSAVKVQRYGKNLINADMWSDIFDKQVDGSYKSNTIIYQSLASRELNLPAAEYTISFYIKCPANDSYIFQLTYEDGTQTSWWKNSTGEYIFCSYKTNGKAIKSISVNYNRQSKEVWFKDLQIELGEQTAYEQYTEATEYPVNADGSVDGVKPLQPTTTLLTDTTGAIIDVEYNRDLNKAFVALEGIVNALIAG